MSAGKAIVSTPYAYATELLAGGRGVLVEPGSPTALATAFIDAPGRPRAPDDHRCACVRRTAASRSGRRSARLPARLRSGRGAVPAARPPSDATGLHAEGRSSGLGRRLSPPRSSRSAGVHLDELTRRRRDHAARRSGSSPIRRTATASTMSPGRSRSTCSTAPSSAGRPSPTERRALDALPRGGVRPASPAGSGTSATSTARWLDARPARRTPTRGRCSRSARPRAVRRRSAVRRARGRPVRAGPSRAPCGLDPPAAPLAAAVLACAAAARGRQSSGDGRAAAARRCDPGGAPTAATPRSARRLAVAGAGPDL